jgi:hypothetical protein
MNKSKNKSKKVISFEEKKRELTGAGYAEAPRILVREGKYQAVATKCVIHKMFNSKKAFLSLNLIEPVDKQSDVRTLCAVFQIHDPYTPRSKLYKIWSKLMLRVPRRREIISPSDLVGHIFEITVRTVTHDERQKKVPDYMQYSVAEIEDVAVRNHTPSTYNQKPITNNQFPPMGGLPSK